jgi:hypothetical protein
VTGTVAQANEIMATPKHKTLTTMTGRAPNRSIAQPITGEKTSDAMAPALTEPAISVLLQPNCCEIGKISTVSVVIAGAILANTTVLDAATTIQP